MLKIFVSVFFCASMFVGENAFAMREMETDRPDRTESPFTVDAGHFQIETSLVEWEEEAKTLSFNVMNLKYGLSQNSDLQVIVESYLDNENSPSGFGDTTLRLKKNFVGNDEGKVSVGIMPFINLPTSEEGVGRSKVDGGIILPFATDIDEDWSFGAMAEFDLVHNDADDEYEAVFISSYTVSRDLFGNLGGYLEFYSESSAEEGSAWIATADVGLTYSLSENARADLGANFGVTDAAEKFNPFLGVSMRF